MAVPAGSAAGSDDRAYQADHAPHFAGRGGAAGWPRRTGGTRCGRPPLVRFSASRASGLRSPGDPGGGIVRAGARLRSLGHAARGAAIPRPAASGGCGGGNGAVDGTGRPGAERPDHRSGPANGGARGASPSGGDDAGRANPGRGGGGGRFVARCSRSAIRCAARDTPADIGLRLAAIADDDPAADRAAISRIRRAARAISPAAADFPGHAAPTAIPAG